MQKQQVTEKLSSYFDLIPQNPLCLLYEPRLRYQHLRILNFVLDQTITAIKKLFIERKYTDFDPHVGDTLCQIRAAKILHIATNPQFNIAEHINYLNKILLKVKLLTPVIERSISIKRSPMLKQKENNQTLEAFLTESKINFNIHPQVDYLIKAYLLTKYKTQLAGKHPKINFKKLCADASISKDLAVRIIRHWQKSIAHHSSEHIKSSSNGTPTLVDLLKLNDDDNREVLPSFFVMKEVINFIKKHNFNLLFIIRNPLDLNIEPITILFETKNGEFELSRNKDIDNPCFTAQAISYLLKKPTPNTPSTLPQKIISHGVEKILLACSANHPQYSGNKLSILNKNNIYQKHLSTFDRKHLFYNELYDLSSEYCKAKIFAEQLSCDYEKPDFIFAEHMLAGTPRSQTQTFCVNKPDLVEKIPDSSYLCTGHSIGTLKNTECLIDGE